mmetsp:Transcript_22023/g.48914  ORF Transcript_22023/g.48914 Transcript_22023/m.48914 type:complete len:407 (+) Transcript_22023:31-1251(+)
MMLFLRGGGCVKDLRPAFRRRFASGLHGVLSEKYADFQPRENFVLDTHPHWFASHMSRARYKIQDKLRDTNVVLEVRDCRAPLSSAQFEMTRELPDHKQRLIVLNKADLVTPNVALAMRDLIESNGVPCLLTNARERRNLIKIKEFALDNVKAKYPRTLGVMLMVIGLPNVGKSTIINGLKNLAFATARHQGKTSRLVHGVKWTLSKVTKAPGTTQHLGVFQLSNQPRLYCYDTPGVSLMKKKNDRERNTKLALLGCMPDHFSGEMYLADYLLYRLNKERRFEYVEELGLPGPSNDLEFVSTHIRAIQAGKKNEPVYIANIVESARSFLTMYRNGYFGKFCLDYLPGEDEVERLEQMLAQTEPPGPWGPTNYPEIPEGLELDRHRVARKIAEGELRQPLPNFGGVD